MYSFKGQLGYREDIQRYIFNKLMIWNDKDLGKSGHKYCYENYSS